MIEEPFNDNIFDARVMMETVLDWTLNIFQKCIHTSTCQLKTRKVAVH